MSDFDKIINDRLNEDDGEFFPRKEGNWDNLSQRLAEFEKANPLPQDTPNPVLKPVWKRWVWTSAAAALVGISGLLFWHFNEVKRLEEQKAGLQQEVVELKLQQQNQSNAAGENTQIAQTDANNRMATKTDLNPAQIGDNTNKGTQKPFIAEKNATNAPVSQQDITHQSQKKRSNANQQNAAVVDKATTNKNRELGKSESPKSTVLPNRNDSQIGHLNAKNKVNDLPIEAKNAPLNKQKVNLDKAITQINPSVSGDVSEGSKGKIAENKANHVDISPKEGEGDVQTGRKNLETVDLAAQNIDKTNGAESTAVTPSLKKIESTETAKTAALASEKAKEDSLAKVQVAMQDKKSEEQNPPPPIIKTDKNKIWKALLPKGFAIGANGVYAASMPEIEGIRPTTGKGLSAELILTKNIAVTASADLLETRFDVHERPRHFHVRDEPNPPKPNVSLHSIGGDQHSRLLSLNVKYIFGTEKWWLQPNVTIGHAWHKIDEHAVNFVFKDTTTGEETPVPTQAQTEKIKDLWQVGVGVEKKIKRWTFGVSAEMQKDFSSPNGKMVAANFGILRGGIKFNIF